MEEIIKAAIESAGAIATDGYIAGKVEVAENDLASAQFATAFFAIIAVLLAILYIAAKCSHDNEFLRFDTEMFTFFVGLSFWFVVIAVFISISCFCSAKDNLAEWTNSPVECVARELIESAETAM